MHKDPIKPSLIISTYNWKEALELTFLSLLNQSQNPFEVIIADDGSKKDTKELIKSYKDRFSFPLIHVWHEDKGFRLSEIRNKAIDKSNGNYIIQIDGDIILHKDFIKDHINNAKRGYFISGSRVLLGKKISKTILKIKKYHINYNTDDIKNKHYTLRLPLISKMLLSPSDNMQKVIRRIRGCNMSFWKKDLLKVNGYDQDIIGWGREDSEISARLINYGLKQLKLKFSGIQYHIYHQTQAKDSLNTNNSILEKTIKNKRIFTLNGINKEEKNLPKDKQLISAIIPTLNEEANIEEAIATLDFVDEIIVIDSLSTDNTVALAKKMGVSVIEREFDDFSSQKNYAISKTKYDWIYTLDADERLNEKLINEIKERLNNSPIEVAFELKMNYYFMGKLMKHGSFKTKKVIRLFNKHYCEYNGNLVHEQLIINGKQSQLTHLLNHKSKNSIDDFIKTQSFYASLKAKELYKRDIKFLYLKAFFKPPFRFFKHFIFQLGFLDGFQGFVFAGIQSYGIFIRYIKLWQLKKENEK
jgi:glycosyltransferase involved in cell wall biosynthesis